MLSFFNQDLTRDQVRRTWAGESVQTNDQTKDLIKNKFASLDFETIDFLKEYVKPFYIRYNENLKSQQLHLVSAPGFYRISMVAVMEEEQKDISFYTTEFLFVPE
nr:hypothetical protein [Candidatus Sigynarchaeota archaeon]